MRIAALHTWPRTTRRAIALQRELVDSIQITRPTRRPRWFAGADAAFVGDVTIAGVVLWDSETDEIIESAVVQRRTRFPYVPGLLSFRELPAVLAAFRRLRGVPDAVLADAQGIAHPRRCGLAAHLGLWLKIPTVGCAKSRLIGTHAEVEHERGGYAALLHKEDRIGTVLRTRSGVRPLYVSPGHLCDHESAVEWTLQLAKRFRLPEPTRQAHLLVTRARSGV